MVLSSYQSLIGDKRYELNNHLSNVLVVINDKKIPAIDPNSLNLNYFNADVLNYSDYYPFGSLVPQRHASVDSYRYGFQGQEKDDELKGEGNSLNFEYRMHDPRVGRFFAIDPLVEKFPNWSPYSFCFNNPMRFIDPDGREPVDWIHWKSSDGRKQYTYHVGIKTIEQAVAAGYTDVHHVAVSQVVYNDRQAFQLHSNGDVSDINGNFVDKGFYTYYGSYISVNTIGRTNLLLNGVSNTFFGVVGAVSSIGSIPPTFGASTGLAAVAFTLSVGEISIGVSQIADSFKSKPSDVLHDYSTVPGLIAGLNGNKYAPLIEGVSSWAPGSLTGGNISGARDALKNISKFEKELSNGAEATDAILDGSSLLEGLESTIKENEK